MYNNKFFNYIQNREKEALDKEMLRNGLAVADVPLHNKHILANSKAAYWVLIGITLFIVYTTIKVIAFG